MTMDEAEFVGGVLVDSEDPRATGVALAEILSSPVLDEGRVRELGLEPVLVEVLRRRLTQDARRIERACAEGAAWVMGRRSLMQSGCWELVASLPPGALAPSELSRSTGKTMLALVSGARRRVRMAAPFVDAVALDFLADALAAATNRGVHIDLFMPTRAPSGAQAMARLLERVRGQGAGACLRIARFRAGAPWAHLKVIAVDSEAAYIGSANLTRAALAGPNLELGVLVRGGAVRTIEEILDSYRDA